MTIYWNIAVTNRESGISKSSVYKVCCEANRKSALYSEEQISDLKQLCCTGQTVLGIDKTFNLCDMHVTVMCYKQLAVSYLKNAEHPLFFWATFYP